MAQLYTKEQLAGLYRDANPGFGYDKMSDDEVLADAATVPGYDAFIARLAPPPPTRFQQMKDITKRAINAAAASPVGQAAGLGVSTAARASQAGIPGAVRAIPNSVMESAKAAGQAVSKQVLGAIAIPPYAGAGVVKGATMGYIDPTQRLIESGLDVPELTRNRAVAAGEFLGAVAPISATSKLVSIPLRAAGVIGKAAAVRPVLQGLAQAAATGATYGAARKSAEDQTRVKNALNDAAIFMAFTGTAQIFDKAVGWYLANHTAPGAYNAARQQIIDIFVKKGASPEKAANMADAGLTASVEQGGGLGNVTTADLVALRKAVARGEKVVIGKPGTPDVPAVRPTGPTVEPLPDVPAVVPAAGVKPMPEAPAIVPVPVAVPEAPRSPSGRLWEMPVAQAQQVAEAKGLKAPSFLNPEETAADMQKYPGGEVYQKWAAQEDIYNKGSRTAVPAHLIEKYNLGADLDTAMFAEAELRAYQLKAYVDNRGGESPIYDMVKKLGYFNKAKVLRGLQIQTGQDWRGRELPTELAPLVRKNGNIGLAEGAAEAFRRGHIAENDTGLFIDELTRDQEFKQAVKRGEDVSGIISQKRDMTDYGGGASYTAEKGRDLAGQMFIPETGPEMPTEKIRPAEGVDQAAFLEGFTAPMEQQAGLFEPPVEQTGQRPGNINISMLPGVTEVAEGVTRAVDDLTNIFTPYAKGETGEVAAATLRENLGKMARNHDRAEAALETAKEMFDKISNPGKLDFIYRMEAGGKQDTPAEQQIADNLRLLLDAKRKEVQDLGTGKLENFLEYYFPHIWEDPEAAVDIVRRIMGRRPLQGSKAFLKQRSIESTEEGIKLGLKPVSYNPVDLVMLKFREMDRYIMAQRTIIALKAEGLVKFIRLGGDIPADFVRINDPIADVYSRNEKGELIIRGRYYAQEDAARILNNYLSAGLRGNFFYDLYRGTGNALNQFQLGLSAFHVGFTSMDATISKFALGINKLSRGDISGALREFARSPFAPITNILSGRRLLQAWYGADKGELTNTIADVMATAGGRAKMDKFYATVGADSLKKAIGEGRILTAAFKLPLMVVSEMAKPVMEYIVPRQKLGIFMDLMKMELERNPGISHTELRTLAQRAWDSVDNRMGQMVYDNLFWNKVTKDLAMASVRSVGWNLGTIREIAGGGVDAAAYFAKFAGGGKPKFTYRMAYIMALPMVAGLYGAIYQYLHTGEGPKGLKDYYFPQTGGFDKNGNPSRVSLPTYMKDIYHYSQAPGQTILNKASPVNNMVLQMLANKDFYGNEIRNADDPIVRQVHDEVGFIGSQFVPFGIRNMQRDTRKTGAARVEPFIGITPAPYDLDMTPAELRAREYMRAKIPVGARTQAAAEKTRIKAEFINNFQVKPSRELVRSAITGGALTVTEVYDLIKEARMTPLERYSSGLTVYELFNVLKLARPSEREILIRDFNKKLASKIKDVTPTERKELTDLGDKVRKLYPGGLRAEIERMKAEEYNRPLTK